MRFRLKDYLRANISGQVDDAKHRLDSLRDSLDFLDGCRIDVHTYEVRTSHWDQDSWFTVTERGPLKKIIKKLLKN